MAYDWEKDLQPITLLVKVPNVLAVNISAPRCRSSRAAGSGRSASRH